MRDLYRDCSLEGDPIAPALTGAAQLRSIGNSSCLYCIV
jgi:hypothetical protein